MYMYIYIYTYVCVYIYMYVCIHVCIYLYAYLYVLRSFGLIEAPLDRLRFCGNPDPVGDDWGG